MRGTEREEVVQAILHLSRLHSRTEIITIATETSSTNLLHTVQPRWLVWGDCTLLYRNLPAINSQYSGASPEEGEHWSKNWREEKMVIGSYYKAIIITLYHSNLRERPSHFDMASSTVAGELCTCTWVNRLNTFRHHCTMVTYTESYYRNNI